jgi:hypothetical protein
MAWDTEDADPADEQDEVVNQEVAENQPKTAIEQRLFTTALLSKARTIIEASDVTLGKVQNLIVASNQRMNSVKGLLSKLNSKREEPPQTDSP